MKNVIGRLPPPDPFWAELGRRVMRERGFIAFTFLTVAIAWAFLLVNQNYRDLCRFAELSRANQIASVRQQAETLIQFAIQDMIDKGASPNDPEVVRLREVTGPRYIKGQTDAVAKRLPPAENFCEILR